MLKVNYINPPYEPECPALDQLVQVTGVEVQHGAIVQAGRQINQSWPLLTLTQTPCCAGLRVHLAGLRPVDSKGRSVHKN
jgi:hypothetical protein